MKLKPLHDRIIVEPLAAEETTKGGIVLPETAKEKPQEGKVVAVGKGKKKEDGTIQPMDLKVGDIVLYGKYSGTEITADGKDVLIMREDDVFAVVGK